MPGAGVDRQHCHTTFSYIRLHMIFLVILRTLTSSSTICSTSGTACSYIGVPTQRLKTERVAMTMSPKVNEPKVATGYLERKPPITQASRDFVRPRQPGRGLTATGAGVDRQQCYTTFSYIRFHMIFFVILRTLTTSSTICSTSDTACSYIGVPTHAAQNREGGQDHVTQSKRAEGL